MAGRPGSPVHEGSPQPGKEVGRCPAQLGQRHDRAAHLPRPHGVDGGQEGPLDLQPPRGSQPPPRRPVEAPVPRLTHCRAIGASTEVHCSLVIFRGATAIRLPAFPQNQEWQSTQTGWMPSSQADRSSMFHAVALHRTPHLWQDGGVAVPHAGLRPGHAAGGVAVPLLSKGLHQICQRLHARVLADLFPLRRGPALSHLQSGRCHLTQSAATDAGGTGSDLAVLTMNNNQFIYLSGGPSAIHSLPLRGQLVSAVTTLGRIARSCH